VTSITFTAPDTAKPLRADAERNRARILEAASELFAQRGLDVSLNEIAHHAGVGVGTVYRRFPDRERLIDDLFEERIEELLALANQALADPDPWQGLKRFLERALELQASNRGLKDLVTSAPDGLARVCRVRERLLPLGVELVRRAHEAGQLREDVDAADLPLVQLLISIVIDAGRETAPDLWRRYLGIILRGLAAHPELEPPLAAPALTAGQVDAVMTRAKASLR